MMSPDLLAAIDAEIARLEQARDLLAGTAVRGARTPAPRLAGRPRKRHLSADARARIAAAQRRRWARQKAAKAA